MKQKLEINSLIDSYKDFLIYSLRLELYKSIVLFYKSLLFYLNDTIFINSLGRGYSDKSKYLNSFRINYTLSQVNWFFYTNKMKLKLSKKSSFNFYNYYLLGIRSIWLGFRY